MSSRRFCGGVCRKGLQEGFAGVLQGEVWRVGAVDKSDKQQECQHGPQMICADVAAASIGQRIRSDVDVTAMRQDVCCAEQYTCASTAIRNRHAALWLLTCSAFILVVVSRLDRCRRHCAKSPSSCAESSRGSAAAAPPAAAAAAGAPKPNPATGRSPENLQAQSNH